MSECNRLMDRQNLFSHEVFGAFLAVVLAECQMLHERYEMKLTQTNNSLHNAKARTWSHCNIKNNYNYDE